MRKLREKINFNLNSRKWEYNKIENENMKKLRNEKDQLRKGKKEKMRSYKNKRSWENIKKGKIWNRGNVMICENEKMKKIKKWENKYIWNNWKIVKMIEIWKKK